MPNRAAALSAVPFWFPSRLLVYINACAGRVLCVCWSSVCVECEQEIKITTASLGPRPNQLEAIHTLDKRSGNETKLEHVYHAGDALQEVRCTLKDKYTPHYTCPMGGGEGCIQYMIMGGGGGYTLQVLRVVANSSAGCMFIKAELCRGIPS